MQSYETRASIVKTALLFVATALVCIFWGGLVVELAQLLLGGAIIAFLVSPLAKLLEKKLSRPLATLLSLVLIIGVLLALVAFVLPALVRQMAVLVDLIPEAFGRLQGLLSSLTSALQSRMPEIALPKLNLSSASGGAVEIARSAAGWLGGLGSGVYKLSLMVVLSYFLMADRENILLRLELLSPASVRPLAVRTGNMLLRELRLYLRGQLTIALAVGILAGLGLTFIGVPSGPLLGAFVGIFNVIPYFGPIIGGVPAVLLALSLSWQKAAFTVGLLFLVQQIDGLVISPRVMGNITGFSPAVVLVALFVGGRLGSIGGMLFALPALMALRTLYRVFVQRQEKN